VLLALSIEALGRARVLAATAESPSLAACDLSSARQVARFLGADHAVVTTREMERPAYRANLGDRCFHCRTELFERLGRLARERDLPAVAYGAIADDLCDTRPGMRAARAAGILAPLLEAGFRKEDVRAVARAAGLPVADKPAGACLASRIPAGTEVTGELLARIGRAERALRRLGLRQLRVRHHGDRARLELDAAGLDRLRRPELHALALRAMRDAGYRQVVIDPQGYRPGGADGARILRTVAPRTGPTRDGGQ